MGGRGEGGEEGEAWAGREEKREAAGRLGAGRKRSRGLHQGGAQKHLRIKFIHVFPLQAAFTEIFFSSCIIFLIGQPLTPPFPLPLLHSPLPRELKKNMWTIK